MHHPNMFSSPLYGACLGQYQSVHDLQVESVKSCTAWHPPGLVCGGRETLQVELCILQVFFLFLYPALLENPCSMLRISLTYQSCTPSELWGRTSLRPMRSSPMRVFMLILHAVCILHNTVDLLLSPFPPAT